jgi:hypothetical protein
LEVSKSAADMFGQPLVDVTGHLTDLHERALHLTKRFSNLLGGLQFESKIKFLTLASIGEDSVGAMASVSATRFCSEKSKAKIAGASCTVLHRAARRSLRAKILEKGDDCSDESEGND